VIGRALLVLAAILGGLAVVGLLVFGKAYRIPSSSMEPTLHCGRPGAGCEGSSSDRVLALRLWWPFDGVERGDLVAYRTPPRARERCGAGGTFLHRVIGLPGERWAERNGVIVIDGKRLREPYLARGRRDELTYPGRKIPPDRYLLLGDNRSQSCDSRFWGLVPRGNLVAKVVATYWPPSRIGFR
jgi:signal peptidase I